MPDNSLITHENDKQCFVVICKNKSLRVYFRIKLLSLKRLGLITGLRLGQLTQIIVRIVNGE